MGMTLLENADTNMSLLWLFIRDSGLGYDIPPSYCFSFIFTPLLIKCCTFFPFSLLALRSCRCFPVSRYCNC